MKERMVFMKNGFNLKNTYLELPDMFYSIQEPTKVKKPKLIKINEDLIKELSLNREFFESEEGLDILSGNKVFEETTPISQAYTGHQFGNFAMLGDGRAVLLGEHLTQDGTLLDIQLKGSGRTPYSRGGDGRAALKPMLREYIISEGMHGLNIETSRSLAVVETGEEVYRQSALKGAILTRIAKSHIRVGTFQYALALGGTEEVKALADYTLDRHFKGYESSEDKYIYLLREVVKNQAKLISKWMLVGFVHGVMNTDNMLISGETIDYGPCAFMDAYDSDTVFSSIDMYARYAYGNQPSIGGWNLARFAETLLDLIHEDREKAIEIAQKEVAKFTVLYKVEQLKGMRRKLGLELEKEEDEYLIQSLLGLMKKYKADYTNTFIALTLDDYSFTELKDKEEFKAWVEAWKVRLEKEEKSKAEIMELMKKSNPFVIPRNHRVEEALEAGNEGDFSVMENLLEALKNPYEYNREYEKYTKLPEKKDVYVTYCGT
ncbi:MAG: protein adenylyltransferase SelO [Clostridium sp.]|uniref:protein adenylyltransferase SelO n=1 Tax=Clostridium sp. TaxID=1506 RepID=UPI003F30D6FB